MPLAGQHAEIEAADISSNGDEVEMEPTNHPELEKKIEAHSISLESKVCLLKLAFWSLLWHLWLGSLLLPVVDLRLTALPLRRFGARKGASTL